MTVIAYYENKLYADRRIVTGAEGVGYAALANKTKITIADDKTYAFLKEGGLLDKQKIDELSKLILKQIHCTNPTQLPELKKQLMLSCCHLFIGTNVLFAIKGKCFHVNALGTIKELPRDQLFVSGSGQVPFFADHQLGYSMDQIFHRVSKTTSLVSKEFDSLNIDTDLIEYSKPLSDYVQE